MSNAARIDTITLRQTLPEVFVNESIPRSEIWLSDIQFRRGEVTLIEAASGTGKSSLCAYLFGARSDYRGQILFNSEDVASFSIGRWQHLRRESIAYLPQELSLFPELTARRNIELKNDLTDAVSSEQIDKWLEELGIADRADYPVGRMSIGQQQRVAIIRTLCQPFDFILLDEPVSHLDGDNNLIVARMVMREALRREAGVIATSVGNRLLLDNPRILHL